MPLYSKYISKDFVIMGSHLALDSDDVWNKIDKRMRTSVRKGQGFGIEIVKVKGENDEIERFKKFCPNGADLPKKLLDIQHMYFAFKDGELLGGIIVTEIEDYLYLHFHAATDKGKEYQVPNLLIWHIVNEFKNSKFKYLDVGASYRPSLNTYFNGWATKKYPIIMHAPEYKPQILINPFDNSGFVNLHNLNKDDARKAEEYLKDFFGGKEYTFFPRAMFAIFALFKWLKQEGRVGEGDEVCIRTTSESPYISSCVSSAIEQNCKWSREISEKTRAIFVIHEFGFVHPKIKELRQIAADMNIPLIEDCAYAWGSDDAGKYGDYVIYSLTKMFPVQFGGFLVGKNFPHDFIWNNFACADKNKEQLNMAALSKYLPATSEIREKRQDNYKYYEEIFGKEKNFFALGENTNPGAYVLKMKSHEEMKKTMEFVCEFGVECGAYWHNDAIFLPVHQNLNKAHLDYIAGSVFGSFGYEEIVKKLG